MVAKSLLSRSSPHCATIQTTAECFFSYLALVQDRKVEERAWRLFFTVRCGHRVFLGARKFDNYVKMQILPQIFDQSTRNKTCCGVDSSVSDA